MKKIYIYIAIFIIALIAIAGFFVVLENKKATIIKEVPKSEETITKCYLYSKENQNGFTDKAWLKINTLNEKVTGEYQNLPAESDSKVGKFSGNIEEKDLNKNTQIINVWWNSLAEGMNVTEELRVSFKEDKAMALFGEMVDRGDGVYLYKNKERLSPSFEMSEVDCEALDDEIIVTKYIRENIQTILPTEPVLGGSWYVTSVKMNPSERTGTIIYEDGHIQGEVYFVYTRNGTDVEIALINALPSAESK